MFVANLIYHKLLKRLDNKSILSTNIKKGLNQNVSVFHPTQSYHNWNYTHRLPIFWRSKQACKLWSHWIFREIVYGWSMTKWERTRTGSGTILLIAPAPRLRTRKRCKFVYKLPAHAVMPDYRWWKQPWHRLRFSSEQRWCYRCHVASVIVEMHWVHWLC